jgi:hypothetical protein
MRTAASLPRLVALTLLVLITALIFQRIRSTSVPDGRSVIEHSSTTAGVENVQEAVEARDPEAEASGPNAEDETLLMRLDPSDGWYTNEVRCWPSVGGIIIAQRVHPVELVFLGVDRFYATPRSSNAAQEDEFCKKLRMVGGKWWIGYWDFEWATGYKMRQLWPDERDVLYLGWPENGKGAWLLRYNNRKAVGGGIGIINNALTMDERCLAIKLSGGAFYENPEGSEYIAPLLHGFGNRTERTNPDLPQDGGEFDF